MPGRERNYVYPKKKLANLSNWEITPTQAMEGTFPLKV